MFVVLLFLLIWWSLLRWLMYLESWFSCCVCFNWSFLMLGFLGLIWLKKLVVLLNFRLMLRFELLMFKFGGVGVFLFFVFFDLFLLLFILMVSFIGDFEICVDVFWMVKMVVRKVWFWINWVLLIWFLLNFVNLVVSSFLYFWWCCINFVCF